MRTHPISAAMLFALTGTLMLAASPLLAPATEPESAMVTGFALEFFLATIAIAFASLAGPGVFQRLGLGPSRIPWGTGVVLAAGTLLLSFALNGVYQLSGFADDSAIAQFESSLEGISGWTIALAIVSFALAPGIAEELLCRGLVQRGLHSRVGPVAALGVAALLFGALHVEPIYAATATVLGAYLGAITLIGGSIRPSIVCHAVNNFVAVVTAAWGFEIGTGPAPSISLLAAFGLAAAALWWAWQSLGGLPEATASSEQVGLQPRSGSDDS